MSAQHSTPRPEDGFSPKFDLDEMRAAQRGMAETIQQVMEMRESYGAARAVVEFSKAQRDKELSEAIIRVRADAMNKGEDIAHNRAEEMAHCEPTYKENMQKLLNDYAHAMAVIKHMDGLKSRFEMFRSISSFEKTLLSL